MVESDDDQVAELVIVLVDPSLKPATAMNCNVFPTVIGAAVGDSDSDVTTGPVTLKVVDPLTPLKEAVMVALPGPIPVASPGLACPVD
jgi:hypothetical protein